MEGEANSDKSIKRGGRRRGGISRNALISIIVVVVAAGAIVTVVAFAPGLFAPTRTEILIDGSSTVFPITAAWAEVMNGQSGAVTYNVAFSGSGAGFEKFCAGRTHLSDASRPIKQSEIDACRANGIEPVEFQVGYDGLSVVVHNSNTFASSLRVQELCRVWTSNTSAGACGGEGPRVTHWNQLSAAWPAEEILLFGPGTDSGTFDYFREVILEAFGDDITDEFTPSENDNTLVQGVANEPFSMGYGGFAYAVTNLDLAYGTDIENATGGDGNDGKQLGVAPGATLFSAGYVESGGSVPFWTTAPESIIER